MLIWCSEIFLINIKVETAVLLNIFVETVIHFFQDTLMKIKFKRTAFIWNIFFLYYYKCFTYTFDHFNMWINKIIQLFLSFNNNKKKNLTDPKFLNVSACTSQYNVTDLIIYFQFDKFLPCYFIKIIQVELKRKKNPKGDWRNEGYLLSSSNVAYHCLIYYCIVHFA